jgi:hypothetical protein
VYKYDACGPNEFKAPKVKDNALGPDTWRPCFSTHVPGQTRHGHPQIAREVNCLGLPRHARLPSGHAPAYRKRDAFVSLSREWSANSHDAKKAEDHRRPWQAAPRPRGSKFRERCARCGIERSNQGEIIFRGMDASTQPSLEYHLILSP